MADFIRFYNHECHQEGTCNVTPADIYEGRREAILRRRERQKTRTQAQRFRYNRVAAMQCTRGEPTSELSVPRKLAESQRC